MPERNKTFLIIFMLSIFLIIPVNGLSQTKESANITQNNDNSEKDNFSVALHKLGFTGIGLDAVAVIKERYDTGVGTGLRFPRKFYFPYSETYSSVMFMGTSNDSLDINIVGIEESLIFSRTHHQPFIVLMGLTAGYYYISEQRYGVRGNTKDEYFNIFLILGAKYQFKSKSIVSQLKYGMRKDLNEIHLSLGMNFYE